MYCLCVKRIIMSKNKIAINTIRDIVFIVRRYIIYPWCENINSITIFFSEERLRKEGESLI